MAADPAQLRAQAERLAAEAEKVERKATELERKLAELSPPRRVAVLLHDHFGHGWGEDEWYYEANWGGPQHANYERIANNLHERWGCDWLEVELRLNGMVAVLQGHTSATERARSQKTREFASKREIEAAHKALDTAIEAAVAFEIHSTAGI